MVAGASVLPWGCASEAVLDALDPLYYPPGLTGLRGSHPGSNTHAHARARDGRSDWGPTTELGESYDLVVVGGGISGLAAAHLCQQKHGRDKTVLVLDNHDDFGGHAKRNEHTIDGRKLITYGGSQSIVEPKHGSEVVLQLFSEIGVETDRFETAYDKDFYKRHNLGAVTYFNEASFGEDKVVKHPYCNYPNYVDGIVMGGKLSNQEAAQQASLSERASAKRSGALGFFPKAVYDDDNPYIYHFPDGNAGVARALVKKMIPSIAYGDGPEALVLAQFRYAELDKASNPVRIRLNSTVVDVRHRGAPDSSGDVIINYVTDDRSYRVSGKQVVMACYNMMIPHIVRGLPEEQSAALRLQTKSPLQYTTVGLRNWRALKEMEIGLAMSPGNMHQAVLMDFPVSMGGYDYTKSPDEPCVIQMISCPYGDTVGAPRLEQYREARSRMLTLEFADYEAEIRGHLSEA